jgi:hypothetical protein
MTLFSQEYQKTRNGFLKSLYNCTKMCTIKRNNRGRNHEHTLSFEKMVEIIDQQEDKCFYSGVQMSFQSNTDFKCSTERIDDNIGYTNDNVVFCCLEFNNQMHWDDEKLKYAFCTQHEIPKCFKNVGISKKWNTKILNLLSNCKNNTNTRNEKLRNKLDKLVNKNKITQEESDLEYSLQEYHVTIDKDEIIKKFIDQQGVCYYSGVPMHPRGDWKMSIERINPSIGYTIENTVLICYIFNTIDNRKNLDHGSGNWTKEKFNIFKESIIPKFN